jgi:hypothetical protein
LTIIDLASELVARLSHGEKFEHDKDLVLGGQLHDLLTSQLDVHLNRFSRRRLFDVVWEVRARQNDSSGRVIQQSEPVRSHIHLSFGATPPAPEIVPIVNE